MSTYSSLIFASAGFEKLFNCLAKIFAVLTVVSFVLANQLGPYLKLNLPVDSETYDWTKLVMYIYLCMPTLLCLVLTIASRVAWRISHNMRFDLPLDDKQK